MKVWGFFIMKKEYYGYMVYDDGRVWSNKTNRFLKGSICNAGYYTVTITPNKHKKTVMIHRVVGRLFVNGRTKERRFINHKDGDKLNNNASNLEWCTKSENSKHAYTLGLTPPPPTYKGKFGYDHNRSLEVHEYDKNTGEYIQSFGSMSEASRKYDYDVSTIRMACDNYPTRKGFYYSVNRCDNIFLQ